MKREFRASCAFLYIIFSFDPGALAPSVCVCVPKPKLSIDRERTDARRGDRHKNKDAMANVATGERNILAITIRGHPTQMALKRCYRGSREREREREEIEEGKGWWR